MSGSAKTSGSVAQSSSSSGPCPCDPDYTELCARTRSAPDFVWSYFTLTGSLCSGSFTSDFITGLVFYWDGYEWIMELVDPATWYIAVLDRCPADPATFWVWDEYGPNQLEIEILGYGPGCCECAPALEEVVVEIYNIDDTLVDTVTLTGNSCDSFEGSSSDPNIGLIVLTPAWSLSSDADPNTTWVSGGLDPCDPIGASFSGESLGYIYNIVAPP